MGALRVVRWSASYDETVIFYRDTIGLSVLESFHESYGLDGTIFGLPGRSAHLEIVRLRDAPHPAHGLDQLVFYLPGGAAQEGMMARGRGRPPGGADRLLGGQRRRYLPGPGRARSGVRVLDLWPVRIVIRGGSAKRRKRSFRNGPLQTRTVRGMKSVELFSLDDFYGAYPEIEEAFQPSLDKACSRHTGRSCSTTACISCLRSGSRLCRVGGLEALSGLEEQGGWGAATRAPLA